MKITIRPLIIRIFIITLSCTFLLYCRAYGDTWSFVVMGDTRGDATSTPPTTTGVSQYLPVIASVIANPSSVQPGAITPSAVFFNGDIINGDDLPSVNFDTQFQNWKTAMTKVIDDAKIPVYTVRGNHENEVTDLLPPNTTLKTAYYDAFGSAAPTVGSPVPQNGPAGQEGFTWNLLLNNVRIIGVDQYFYYNSTKQGTTRYYQIDQAWLNQQLSNAAPARFTFVMAHEPSYYLDSGGDNPEGDFYGTTNSDGSVNPAGVAARGVFWNSLGVNGVRMYLCCHVHNLQIGYAYDNSGNLIYQSVTGNGGAPIASQGTTDPNLTMTDQNFSNYGFALFTVTDHTITITYYLYNPITTIWSIDSYFLVLSAYSFCATNSNAQLLGGALDAISSRNNATGDMADLLTTLNNLSDAGVASALNAMLPIVDGSVLQVTNASFDKFMSTVISHLNSLASSGTTSVSTGADTQKKDPAIWAQGYGSYLHEDPRGLSNGYDASILGTTLGVDAVINDYLIVGITGGYAHDFIRSKDNSGRNDIDNYQWTLYASYARDAYYLDAACAFAYNTYDSSRHVTFPGFDRTPKGDYDGEQYLGYIEGGYTLKYKKLEVTPLASFQYTHLYIAGYTETGGGAVDFSYKAQDYDFAQTGFGAKIEYPFNTKYGILIPELRFKWLYDWVGDAAQTTATFAGFAPSFSTYGTAPAQSSFDIGTKLTLVSKNNVTLSVNYDLQLQEDLYGHYGYVEARYSF